MEKWTVCADVFGLIHIQASVLSSNSKDADLILIAWKICLCDKSHCQKCKCIQWWKMKIEQFILHRRRIKNNFGTINFAIGLASGQPYSFHIANLCSIAIEFVYIWMFFFFCYLTLFEIKIALRVCTFNCGCGLLKCIWNGLGMFLFRICTKRLCFQLKCKLF